MQINLVKASVLDLKVDAIVNAANNALLGGGGVDGAIHKAAGSELYNYCLKLGGCKTGEAKITPAFNIKDVKYIIHTVGPVYHGDEADATKLASCYVNSLKLAIANNCQSIAFPCISTGVYGYPLDEAASIVVDTLEHFKHNYQDYLLKIYLCCFRQIEYLNYKKLPIFKNSDEF